MICSYIRNCFKNHKKVLFSLGIFLGFFFSLSDVTFAAAAGEGLTQEQSDKIVGILNGFITILASIMGMITSFITIFLYPGWVNGTLFGLQDYLKDIWILISNVVYFIFAFIIIVIAFMNIIGKGEGNWELKQAMPKFIIGVLIVPFSWFFVQFVLAISAILTVGVLTLPYDSFRDEALLSDALDDTELAGSQICRDVIISLSGEFNDPNATSLTGNDDAALSENIKCADGGLITVREIFEGGGGADGLNNSIFGIISVYTYGILKIQELDTIAGADLTTIKSIADLVLKIFFDLFFIVVYLLLMVALFLALIVRGVRLWIYAMLSPAFGLLYFFGKSSDGFGKTGEKFNIKEFIALALVPVYVAAALSFGLVFILTAAEGLKVESSTDDLDSIEAGGFKLSIIGAHANGQEEKSVIGKLIVEMFGVVILWIAVMAALGASKTTEAIVQPIAKFGEDVGNLAAKAPTYAPIIPTGNGQSMSVASLPTVSSTIKGSFDSQAQERGSEFARGIGNLDSTLQDIRTELVRGNAEFTNASARRAVELTAPAVMAASSFQDLRNSPELHDRLRELGTRLDVAGSAEVDLSNPAELRRFLKEIHNASLNHSENGLLGRERITGDLTQARIDQILSGRVQAGAGNTTEGEPTGSGTVNNFTLNMSEHIEGNNVTDRGVTDIAESLRSRGSSMTETEVATEVRSMLSGAEASVDRDDAIRRVLTELSDFVEESQ